MKFKGEPNLAVMDHVTGARLLQFDENGEFETNDEMLINRMKPYFEEVINNDKSTTSGTVQPSSKRVGGTRQQRQRASNSNKSGSGK